MVILIVMFGDAFDCCRKKLSMRQSRVLMLSCTLPRPSTSTPMTPQNSSLLL